MDRSLIAGANALFRREERRYPPARRVVDDPFAALLVEHHPVVWAVRLLRYVVPPLWRAVEELRTAHTTRHAAVDALTRAGLDAGFRQVVVLGAGYDMRASRFHVEYPRARWFEVDRPALLRRKEALLAGQPGINPQVVRLGVDIGRGPLLEPLVGAGFRPEEPALVVAEGLIHYLERDRVEALVAELARGGPRRFVLTFIDRAMLGRESVPLRGLFRAVREIPRTFFTVAELSALGARHGLVARRAWTWEEQVKAFAPAATGRPVGVSQTVVELGPLTVG